MLGITSPYTHELPQYLGYDICFFKSNIRFLEVVLNREGESNSIVGLFFDGATNYFSELPLPNNETEIKKVYNYIKNTIRGEASKSFMIINKSNRSLHRMNIFHKFAALFKGSKNGER